MSLWIIILSIIGIINASYIAIKKKRHERLTCYIGHDCNKVIKSRYSKMFGIDNEIIGIIYYIFLIIAVIILSNYDNNLLSHIFFGIISVATLSSLALVYIQIKILKEYCDYCLYSFIINVIIFVLALFNYVL